MDNGPTPLHLNIKTFICNTIRTCDIRKPTHHMLHALCPILIDILSFLICPNKNDTFPFLETI